MCEVKVKVKELRLHGVLEKLLYNKIVINLQRSVLWLISNFGLDALPLVSLSPGQYNLLAGSFARKLDKNRGGGIISPIFLQGIRLVGRRLGQF